jgi:hypothetical protein
VWAWDRDPKAIERVRGNAARAGLTEALGLAVARLGGTPGWIRRRFWRSCGRPPGR